MESSFTLWEERTGFHYDEDILVNGLNPTHLIVSDEFRDDDIITGQEDDYHTSHNEEDTSQLSESSLEVKMKDMMSLDTTGKDFVVLQHSCVEDVREYEKQLNFLVDEPIMCIEKNTTYWTGGGGESLTEGEFPTLSDDKQLDVGQTVPHLTVEMEPAHSNARICLPLQKTLRNLRLLDLKLKYNNHQLALEHPRSERNNESSSDENDSKFSELREKENIILGDEKEAETSYLIELLSQCHFKLEQMEELRHYSRKLAWSLWEAQESNEYLKEKVAELHRDNAQKEEEIFLLTEELIRSRRLCQKSERVTHLQEKATQPSDHTGNRSKQREFESIYTINDKLAVKDEPTGQDTSKICVIL
ncbi:uncharacterized protein LOC134957059 [Pseudophryne corroboree]|uniref:uncharacterized protein LOC134957059 n=1 Tax=Pseudophryne corroboree TaxID=495146 RepID=UPI003081DA0B